MVARNIVLLHGWGASREKLIPLGEELEKRGWKVYVPKIPGFIAPPPKVPWGLKEYTDFIIKACNKFFKGKKYIIFGHSFGGRIALKASIFRPSLLGGIILCSASGLSRGNLLKRYLFWTLAKLGKGLMLIPSVAKIWRIFLYKLSREHDYERLSGVMRETFKKVLSEDLKPLVQEIEVPVLVFWGKKDKMTPVKDAYYIKSKKPHTKLVLFKNEGHQLPYNRPRTIVQEIDKWFTETY
jgi:pimeloyl-ACP methyl ester carboxylesterase